MSGWLVILLAVGIMTLGWVVVERNRIRHGITRDWLGSEKINRADDGAGRQELEAEVVELRERVKVLERIATDPALRTAEEIEKLRDN